jgi:enoyl-CoA hydratase/carnithine racemase
METLRYERTGHVGWLHLNRPQKLNSMTVQMWEEMRTLGQELQHDDELRALVVIGEGRSFSTGIDTAQFGGNLLAPVTPNQPSEIHKVKIHWWLRFFIHKKHLPGWKKALPYDRRSTGHALGAGMQLALACDIRVVARNAQFGLLEHRYGLIPDLGGTQRLPRLVGAGKAKEMIFTAKIIDAEEAQRLGLVEQLVDDNTWSRLLPISRTKSLRNHRWLCTSETSDQCRARYADTTRIAPRSGRTSAVHSFGRFQRSDSRLQRTADSTI